MKTLRILSLDDLEGWGTSQLVSALNSCRENQTKRRHKTQHTGIAFGGSDIRLLPIHPVSGDITEIYGLGAIRQYFTSANVAVTPQPKACRQGQGSARRCKQSPRLAGKQAQVREVKWEFASLRSKEPDPGG